MDNCKFCQIAQKKIQDHIFWEDQDFTVFLENTPANPGHCMIIPKKHIDDIFDLDDDLYSKLFKTAKKISKPLKKAMNAKRIGVAVSGFAVPHAHLHLVPLHNPDELFDSKKFTKGKPEELKEIQNKLIKEFESL